MGHDLGDARPASGRSRREPRGEGGRRARTAGGHQGHRVQPGRTRSLATVLLADMGADVIRVVEPTPSRPDPPSRRRRRKAAEKRRRRAGFWVDRNKRSLSLDLKKPEAQEVLRRLATDADVLVEGFRPGVMKRLGADYETLSALNPRLVYCSLSGFGQDGPYRRLPRPRHQLPVAGRRAQAARQAGPGAHHPAEPRGRLRRRIHARRARRHVRPVRPGAHRPGPAGRRRPTSTPPSRCCRPCPSFMAWFGGGPEPEPTVGTFDGTRPYYTTYVCADGKHALDRLHRAAPVAQLLPRRRPARPRGGRAPAGRGAAWAAAGAGRGQAPRWPSCC